MTRHDELPKALHAVNEALKNLREIRHIPTTPQAAGDAFGQLTEGVRSLSKLAEQLQTRAERFVNLGTGERAEREGKTVTQDQVDTAIQIYTETGRLALTTKHLQHALRAVSAAYYELDAASLHTKTEI
ncbi:hypothetical protein AB0L88_01395 [Saccharopolyspora shandongensis]|uniref:hypothetical protein n=1 Tax=Saccharopolyspora shandongensis TaxID=418495 RepID=UPI0034327C40